ncbi:hypothetical protein ACO0K9_15850 [Undibacterium sp. Ji50W]|uniref:hypothetical protein n=1 Tax=Undibacterium sp. Ji50W TaxID=3413041 RepID=UPI003BF075AF
MDARSCISLASYHTGLSLFGQCSDRDIALVNFIIALNCSNAATLNQAKITGDQDAQTMDQNDTGGLRIY